VGAVYPNISGPTIIKIVVGGCALVLAVYAAAEFSRKSRGATAAIGAPALSKLTLKELRNTWRMPPLEDPPAPQHLTLWTRVWMGVLRGYLVVAVALVVVKVVQSALA
jgi:hypothetical protein